MGPRGARERGIVSVYAPLRLLAAAAAGLLLATLIASSSAHALLLGDAVVRSAPGAPLRAVIPLKPTVGEALEGVCFRLAPVAGAEAGTVTAKVSVERAAATPRLVVTTQEPIAEPVVRFAIEAGCDAALRRNYVVAVDARAASASRRVAVATLVSARAPGQEQRKTAVIGRTTDAASLLPAGAAQSATSRSAHAEGDSSPPAATAAVGRSAPPLRTEDREDADRLTWYVAAPLLMGLVALAVLFLTRRRAPPELPDWTRGGEYTGPRSYTDMSAQPVTLSHGDLTPMPRSVQPRAEGAALRVRAPVTAANSLRRAGAHDLSTLDTLIDDVSEADAREESAVRDAFAAARDAVEREEDNAILRAIDAAEREMLYVPPTPAEAAIDRTLENELTQPRRPDKAAA